MCMLRSCQVAGYLQQLSMPCIGDVKVSVGVVVRVIVQHDIKPKGLQAYRSLACELTCTNMNFPYLH